jgi:predicted DNA-binding protein
MATVHSFRLRNGDHELEGVLAGMTGKEKSDFIREALNFYIRYGEKINKIDEIYSGIREILSRLDDGVPVRQLAGREKEEDQGSGEADEVLIESIQELLNL